MRRIGSGPAFRGKQGQPARRWAAFVVAAAALGFAVGPASAQAVSLTPTATPLVGSNFQGGDGHQDNFLTFNDWQGMPGPRNRLEVPDPNALDTTISGKENEPVDWDLTTTAGG